MGRLRHLIRTFPSLAVALAALALAVRLLVPAGFMPVAGANGLTITLCTGHGALRVSLPGQDAPADGDHADQPCAFTGLAVATPAADVPPLPAATVAFADGPLQPDRTAPAIPAAAWLRPPLRGPPVASRA